MCCHITSLFFLLFLFFYSNTIAMYNIKEYCQDSLHLSCNCIQITIWTKFFIQECFVIYRAVALASSILFREHRIMWNLSNHQIVHSQIFMIVVQAS